MATCNMQGEVQRASGCRDSHLPVALLPVGRTYHIGLARQGKGHDTALACQLPPDGAVRVIGWEYGRTLRRQRLQHRTILMGHSVHRLHELEVLALGVVDQRHNGLNQFGQVGNLARVVHAQFHHPHGVGCLQAQQRERHANIVVEIAFSGKRLRGLPGPQDRRDHLGDRGLAVAAGHGDQRQLKLGAPSCSQLAQRQPGVRHFQPGQTGRGQAMRGQSRHRTLRGGLRQKIMGVKFLAAEGHKQIPRAQRTRVGVHTKWGGQRVPDQLGTRQPMGGLLQIHHVFNPPTARRAASAIATWAWSE